jgi:hypothetical protein
MNTLLLLLVCTSSVFASKLELPGPVDASMVSFLNASSCAGINAGTAPGLSCWMQQGCVTCETAPNTYTCLNSVSLVNGNIVFANNTCAALNTTYGSHIIYPEDGIFDGMGDWVYKLLDRKEVMIIAADVQQANAAATASVVHIQSSLMNFTNLLTPQNLPEASAALNSVINMTINVEKEMINDLNLVNQKFTDEDILLDKFLQDLFQNLQAIDDARTNATMQKDLVLLVEAVKLHHELAVAFYCEAATRVQQRLVLADILGSVFKGIQILHILTAYQDVINLQIVHLDCLKNVNCSWNSTRETQLQDILNLYIDESFNLLYQAELFKAIVEILGPRIGNLTTRTCMELNYALQDLDEVLTRLESGLKTDIAFLRSRYRDSLGNITKLQLYKDLFLAFIDDVHDIEISITNDNDTNAVAIIWEFIVTTDGIGEAILDLATEFCLYAEPFLNAHCGTQIGGSICVPSEAVTMVKKRQDGTGLPGLPVYSISTTTNADTTSPTGSPSSSHTGSPSSSPASGSSIALSVATIVIAIIAIFV